MTFYAYWPIAGRFLVKDSTSLRWRDVAGCFSEETLPRFMYPKTYGKQPLYQVLDKWGIIAKNARISKAGVD